VGGTGLELLDELVRERLVEFKEKLVLIAHGWGILPPNGKGLNIKTCEG
jgi:hypothetical protein